MSEFEPKVFYCTDEGICNDAPIGTKIFLKHQTSVSENPRNPTETYQRLLEEGEVEISVTGHAQLTSDGWNHYNRIFPKTPKK